MSSEKSLPEAWFQRMPFATELLSAAFLFSLVPLTYAIYFATSGEWLKGAALGVAWAAVFPVMALALHRRRMIHIGVSIFAVVSVFALGALIFYLGLKLQAV
jgi:hypothetical protein